MQFNVAGYSQVHSPNAIRSINSKTFDILQPDASILVVVQIQYQSQKGASCFQWPIWVAWMVGHEDSVEETNPTI